MTELRSNQEPLPRQNSKAKSDSVQRKLAEENKLGIIPLACSADEAAGWTINCKFIKQIIELIEEREDSPDMETVETVIISLRDIGVLK